jgi:Zn-dependent protease
LPEIQVSEKVISFLSFIPVFLFSIAVHEFAHAWSAYKYGDSTAKDEGRMTLNPFKHLDLVGSVIMPIAAFATGMALIGWAKPVPVNKANFKDPMKHDAVVSFAGPLSNLILALLLFIVFLIVVKFKLIPDKFLINILWFGVTFNIFLMLFNLLPIPPLDGSHILFNLFPNKFTSAIMNLGFYGTIVLLIFIYSPLWTYFLQVIRFIQNILLGIALK